MLFGIILIRILFIACMVFIIGYIFRSFSKNKTLTTLSKIASIVAIVLFIGMNIFAWHGGRSSMGYHHNNDCYMHQKDSAEIK